jgi:alpha-galactosidase
MNEKIVLFGAGSAVFTRGLVADLIRRKWDTQLVLVDCDSEALAVAEGLARKMLDAAGSHIKLSATTERRKALTGATVVICTIGVGGRRAWEQDVFVPRKYGIFQPVGDTCMPGGSSRALRMIPAMCDIARDVQDVAPAALFFNYGNPMAATCQGIRKGTGANVIGLCHGVPHVGQHLARMLDVPAEAVKYTAVGINHLTWFTEFRVRGVDAMPRLLQIARDRRGKETPNDHPFAWKLFELFGAFPAVLDRHICEFFPQFYADGSYYGGRKLGVDAYSFEDTISGGDKTYAQMRELGLSKSALPADYLAQFEGEHEQVTDIIESIRSNDQKVYSANVPNVGQVPNLPRDVYIECPTIADGGTLKPLQQAPLSAAIAGTLATRFAWVETIAEAALEGSRDKFIQALILDGAVASLEQASSLADELLAVQKAYLPQFQK